MTEILPADVYTPECMNFAVQCAGTGLQHHQAKGKNQQVNWALIASTIPIGIAVNLLYQNVVPELARRTARTAARISSQSHSSLAKVRIEEMSALIDERPGTIYKLVTAIILIASSIYHAFQANLKRLNKKSSPTARDALAWSRPSRWFIASVLLLTATGIITAISTLGDNGQNSRSPWWILTIALLVPVTFLAVLRTTSLPKRAATDTLVADLAAQAHREIRNLGAQSITQARIPYRITIDSDGAHQSTDELITSLESQQRIAVVGPPGAGKTSLLYELARQSLEHITTDAYPHIPILLRASEWRVGHSLTKWLTDELVQRFNLKESTAYSLMLQGSILLLLDGLDEMPHDRQARAAQVLNDGLDGCPALHAVITCRELEFKSLEPFLPGFIIVQVAPLTDADIRTFLGTLPPEANAAAIAQALETSPTLREAARNPLLLRLLIYALSVGATGSRSLSNPAWSAIALGSDLARNGDLENALRVYEAAGQSEESLSAALAEVLMGQVLARLGKYEAADSAFGRAKSAYGWLLENLSSSSRSSFRMDEDQLKIIRSLRAGVTYDDGQISSAALLPPGAVQRALSALEESGLVRHDDEGDVGRRWRLTEAALAEKTMQ